MACSAASSVSAQIHALIHTYTYAWTHTHTKPRSPHAIMCLRLCYFYTLMTSIIDSRLRGLLPAAARAYEQHFSFLATPAASSYNITIKCLYRKFAMFCVGCVEKYMIKWVHASTHSYTFTCMHAYCICAFIMQAVLPRTHSDFIFSTSVAIFVALKLMNIEIYWYACT